MTPSLDTLRYPTGPFTLVTPLIDELRERCIAEIEALPAALGAAVADLTDSQLDTPYRPGGWTVRQVVHHVADSHMHSYLRFKLALSEDGPRISGYDEGVWATFPDAATLPVAVSLNLLEGLHRRWAVFLRALRPEDFNRTIRHPEQGEVPLATNLQLYAWHGRHHVAHITALREREGW